MTEEWRQVTIPNCSMYSVSSESKIRNKKGIIMKPTPQGNIALRGKQGRVRKYVHVISCMAFHGPPPSSTHTVDHIDRDPKNNNIRNLRWASKSLQMKNRNPFRQKGVPVIYKTSTSSVSFKSISEASTYLGIEDHILRYRLKGDRNVVLRGLWKGISDGILQYNMLNPRSDSNVRKVPSWILKDDTQANVNVSSCGLVNKRKYWSTGNESGRPTKYFVITIKKETYLVHRLVAAAFLGKPVDPTHTFINHRDGNGLNNRIENLEWVSSSENNRHAIETGLVGGLQPVVQYSLDGIRMAEFPSISEAGRYINGGSSSICQACKGIIPSAYKYMWAYKSEAPERKDPVSRKTTSKEVRMYDLNGHLISTFVSRQEAAKALNLSTSYVTKCCTKKNRVRGFTLSNTNCLPRGTGAL